ncbi:MAG: hypothetical protein ACR2N2_11135 [Acidimicrobiia bacterium]
MTDTAGAVYDLGYEPHDGERLGRSGARRTLFFDGVRRVLGLRRKARRKILPWTLIVIAVVPAVVFVGIQFFIPIDASELASATANHSDFFGLGGTIVLLFTALAAPELLIPDRRDGVLSMLSSRPLTSNDYVATRFASLLAIVFSFLLIPQLFLYVGQAATGDEGLLRGLVESAGVIPKIIAVALIYAIAYVPLGFVVASLSNRKAIGAAIYIGVIIGLTAIAEAVVENATFTGGKWFALIAPINTADAANAWVFGETNSESLLAAAGVSPGYAVLALAILGGAATAFSFYRYRSLM